MTDSERLTFICPKWLKDAIKQAATDKGIGMSEYIKDTLKGSLPSGTLKKPITENEPESKVI
jgi:hypothetical protein